MLHNFSQDHIILNDAIPLYPTPNSTQTPFYMATHRPVDDEVVRRRPPSLHVVRVLVGNVL